VVIHVDESVLSHDGEGGCELEDGTAVSPETARRLACDASLVRNGRKTRAIPPAMRRALRSRDRGCRFPGCENRRFLDAHHIHHWARGGPTSTQNLLLLCRRHHRLLHEGGYRVDPPGRFYDASGRELAAVPSLPRGSPLRLLDRRCARLTGPCDSSGGLDLLDFEQLQAELLESLDEAVELRLVADVAGEDGRARDALQPHPVEEIAVASVQLAADDEPVPRVVAARLPLHRHARFTHP
jgi:hypothetical protein